VEQFAMPRLTVKEAAAFLHVSTSFLDKLRVKGGGPIYSKVGAKVIYDAADLEAWIDLRKRVSTSAASAPAPRRRSSKSAA
jgi:predicted DNA-binding transcriptional regulator AlpA